MPYLGPISRTDLIFYFKKLGFVGPRSGAKHQYMIKGVIKVPIPILTAATSAESYWLESSGKLILLGMNGRRYSGKLRQLQAGEYRAGLRLVERNLIAGMQALEHGNVDIVAHPEFHFACFVAVTRFESHE